MADKIRKFFKDKDLIKSVLFTIMIMILYRLGTHIPVPGVPYGTIAEGIGTGTGAMSNIMSMLNVFSGGAFGHTSLFSLSIMPYVTATIIMQILGWVVPAVNDLQKSGAAGQNKINQYARYLTLALATINAISYYFLFINNGVSFKDSAAPEWMLTTMFIASLVGGTMLLMYMGEKITDTQVFNGSSILIFVNVLSSVPMALYNSLTNDTTNPIITYAAIAIIIAMVPLLVILELGQRRIPITFARQTPQNGKFSVQTTYMPLKVNSQGVVPIILATSFLYIPLFIMMFFPDNEVIKTIASNITSGPINWVLTAALIFFFSFFYSSVAMRPDDTADNLAKSGAFISNPRIAPGQDTADYIQKCLHSTIIPSSFALAFLAIVPNIIFSQTGNSLLQVGGGTSLLILIGVMCQSIAAIDSKLTMTSYDSGEFTRNKRRVRFGE